MKKTIAWVTSFCLAFSLLGIPVVGFADEGDGVDGAFLIGVTYEPRMEVGDAKGYRYAVCVYSGYSTEGEPAWIEP